MGIMMNTADLGNGNCPYISYIRGNTLIGVSYPKVKHYCTRQAAYDKHNGVEVSLCLIAEVAINNVSCNMPSFSRSHVVARNTIHRRAYSVVCMIQIVVCLKKYRMPMV